MSERTHPCVSLPRWTVHSLRSETVSCWRAFPGIGTTWTRRAGSCSSEHGHEHTHELPHSHPPSPRRRLPRGDTSDRGLNAGGVLSPVPSPGTTWGRRVRTCGSHAGLWDDRQETAACRTLSRPPRCRGAGRLPGRRTPSLQRGMPHYSSSQSHLCSCSSWAV